MYFQRNKINNRSRIKNVTIQIIPYFGISFDNATTMNTQINKLLTKLETWYKAHPKLLIALSGGVDSCLAAYLGQYYLGAENAIAVISNSESLKQKDLIDARKFADSYDIKLEEINAGEINDPNYAANPVDRCYFCKTNLYEAIHHLVKESYIGFEIANGNNFTDLGDYRPGINAANENQILSPFADCEITKEDIRLLSKHFNLFVWDKPASPCLSSRFPYGEAITIPKLNMIEQAEDYINSLGFKDVRVRYNKGTASIEVPNKEVSKLIENETAVNAQLKTYGFTNAKIDTEGLVSGKLNRAIGK